VKVTWREGSLAEYPGGYVDMEGSLAEYPGGYVEKVLEMGISFHSGPTGEPGRGLIYWGL